MQQADLYTYRVVWSGEDEEFVGLCAELPGLSWLEPDRHAALDGITKLVKETLEDMKANGEPIPKLNTASATRGLPSPFTRPKPIDR